MLQWLRQLYGFWRVQLIQVSWPALFSIMLLHMLGTYLLLTGAGETELTASWSRYLYFYLVTISTVGYGDFSPATTQGTLITALLLIIPGLGLFGSFLGKLIATLNDFSRRTMKGTHSGSHLSDHILIFGWDGERTQRIIRLILADKNRLNRQILLCTTELEEHPLPEFNAVSFIRLKSYTEPEELNRTGLKNASKVIIDSTRDEDTLTIALAVGGFLGDETQCHISAYFEDEHKAGLLQTHVPTIECSSNHAAESLARSMQDPGSIRLMRQLLSTLEGDTQFSMDVPAQAAPVSFAQLFELFKQEYQATLIGVSSNRQTATPELNPSLSRLVLPGEVLYYICNHRLHAQEIQWPAPTQ